MKSLPSAACWIGSNLTCERSLKVKGVGVKTTDAAPYNQVTDTSRLTKAVSQYKIEAALGPDTIGRYTLLTTSITLT